VSNKFNSNRTLNKTPGVCHSPRAEPAAPTDPPPPGTFPDTLFCNATFTADVGDGFETHTGENLTCIKEPPFGIWGNAFMVGPGRTGGVNFSWFPAIKTFQFSLTLRNTSGGQIETAFAQRILGDDPLPIIINNFTAPPEINIELAVVDVWM